MSGTLNSLLIISARCRVGLGAEFDMSVIELHNLTVATRPCSGRLILARQVSVSGESGYRTEDATVESHR